MLKAFKQILRPFSSPLLIVMACFLWSLDIIVRYPTSLNTDNRVLVFLENLLGLIFITPILLKTHKKNIVSLNKSQWGHVAFLGVFGSALAGFFFVSSIKGIGPDNFSFFQIFQPLIVIFLAKWFLKERLDSLYGMMGLWILISCFMMISHDFSFTDFYRITSENKVAVVGSLLAMTFWGMSTVVGKSALKTMAPEVVLFWRWTIALIASGLFIGKGFVDIPWKDLFQVGVILRMFFISIFSGIFAMYIYYRGLRKLPASMVAFYELSYPAFGIMLGQFYFNDKLYPTQLLGFFSLLFALALLGKIPRDQESTFSLR